MESQITLVASKAVISLTSYGGETSTNSSPHTFTFLIMYSKSFNASRGNKPPGSGQPVPGTNPASIQSISKEIYTPVSYTHLTLPTTPYV